MSPEKEICSLSKTVTSFTCTNDGWWVLAWTRKRCCKNGSVDAKLFVLILFTQTHHCERILLWKTHRCGQPRSQGISSCRPRWRKDWRLWERGCVVDWAKAWEKRETIARSFEGGLGGAGLGHQGSNPVLLLVLGVINGLHLLLDYVLTSWI